MKRKFLILTLCFTIIFSSLNVKKVDAFDFVISPTVLAVVSTLAVGTGIALKKSDDIYDIGRLFYDYIKRSNQSISDVLKVFATGAFVANDNKIKVNSNVLEIVKSFFNDITKKQLTSQGITYTYGLPILRYSATKPYDYNNPIYSVPTTVFSEEFYFGEFKGLAYTGKSGLIVDYYFGDLKVGSSSFSSDTVLSDIYPRKIYYDKVSGFVSYVSSSIDNWSSDVGRGSLFSLSALPSISIPYSGKYSWDNVSDYLEEGTGDLPLPIPGNLGDLVGKNPSDIWDKNYENGLVGNGNLSIPGVDNPSIGIGGATSFPNVSVENPPTDIPGVENPPVGVIPPFPSFGNSLDFSPMYLTNINDKFPFSLPWDIGRLIEKFDIEPKAPIFKVPIFTSEIVLDLTIFDEWANIVRFFVLIGFVLSLILISTKLLG